jgi:hypothetical protein
MAILRDTDVMRDSSVIPERIGRKGRARRSPRNDNRGNSCEGNQRFFDCVGGPKAVRGNCTRRSDQNDNREARKTRVLAGKMPKQARGWNRSEKGIEKVDDNDR